MDRSKGTIVLAIFTICSIVYIWLPLLTMMIFSFKTDLSPTLPYPGASLRWYSTFFKDTVFIQSLFRSLQVGLITMIISTLLVVSASLGLRGKYRGRDALFYLLILGMIVPGVIYGLGAAIFFGIVKATLSIWTVVAVQVVWTVPFGMILMLARFDPLLMLHEQAASTLGANPFRVFRTVTFPLISPQVMAAALFAFTLSFGDLMRTALTTSVSDPLLSVHVFGFITAMAFTPEFYALGTTVTGISIVMLIVAGFILIKQAGGQKFFR